jgi:hypothetical protein
MNIVSLDLGAEGVVKLVDPTLEPMTDIFKGEKP